MHAQNTRSMDTASGSSDSSYSPSRSDTATSGNTSTTLTDSAAQSSDNSEALLPLTPVHPEVRSLELHAEVVSKMDNWQFANTNYMSFFLLSITQAGADNMRLPLPTFATGAAIAVSQPPVTNEVNLFSLP